ncbi:MAG TPA: thioredoxin domain-containing protein [Candidatus Polarisedimenticolia bacterium]|nr:thioredoxin domain-containing protein [Candidatus Polarisedimenticolia bacterium]
MKTNRLERESSPYLKQHAANPVDWYPWGEEALKRARAEDRPIFLSIGYSACHWCHVMERESFEDERIAALMNERFVSIKVDREERPDLDEIYMAATQLLTGQGGWPNSVFLTPDLKPFYAGTYFPPDARWGRPGFAEVLAAVSEAYRDKKEEVSRVAEEVAQKIRGLSAQSPSAQSLSPSLLNRAFGEMAGRFDNAEGGFGGAPKFPHGMDISFLLRYHRRTGNPEALRMAVLSLDKMARGGIYDQLGGGFHRYAVDGRWLVPHFEKMLYDNALLARAYLEAAQAVRLMPPSSAVPKGGAATAAFFRGVARDTLDWVLREMTSPEGGFYSSLDADSEGEEGRYYVWTAGQIESALGPQDGPLLCGLYGVTPAGNFERGASVLHLERTVDEMASELRSEEADLRLRIAGARARLLKARDGRARPGRDEKILADWNGLMIATMAFASRVLDETRYREAARRAARLVLDRMRRGGRLLHSYKDGDLRHAGYLTDHADMLWALLELYAATFETAWVDEARGLAEGIIEFFGDDPEGGFFLTAKDHETLIARTRENNDGATPAGVSVAALALTQLAGLVDEASFAKRAEEVLRLYRDNLERFPSAFGMMLCALDRHLDRPREVVLAARPDDPALRSFLQALGEIYLPNAVIALSDPAADAAVGTMPLLRGKPPVSGRPTAYVCEQGTCKAPVTSAGEMRSLLSASP